MSPKILTVLLIVLCFAHYSRQEDKPAVKPVTTTVAAPVTYAAPRAVPVDWNHDGVVDWRDGYRATNAWPVDWNHDGVVDWRDGWRTGGAWSADWNHDGVVDWRDGWRTGGVWPADRNHDGVVDWRDGWNGAYAPTRYVADWNRDGVVDWRDDLAWNGAWRGNYATVAEPVVTRRLGSNASTASILRSQRSQQGLKSIGNHILNFVALHQPSDEEMFKMFDLNEDGFITIDEFYDKIHPMDPDTTKEVIRKHFEEAGAMDGKIDLQTLKKAIAQENMGPH